MLHTLILDRHCFYLPKFITLFVSVTVQRYNCENGHSCHRESLVINANGSGISPVNMACSGPSPWVVNCGPISFVLQSSFRRVGSMIIKIK